METMEDSADFSTSNSDGVLISRAAAVFEACSEGQPGSLCGQCHTALAELISSSQTLGRGESHEIQVPYFGAVEIIRKDENTSPGTLEMAPNDKLMLSTSSMMNHDFPSLAVAEDMFFSYHGPWESHQQDSGWPNDSAGLDSTNVVLDCYLASEFPM